MRPNRATARSVSARIYDSILGEDVEKRLAKTGSRPPIEPKHHVPDTRDPIAIARAASAALRANR
jgi:hypothetical protein